MRFGTQPWGRRMAKAVLFGMLISETRETSSPNEPARRHNGNKFQYQFEGTFEMAGPIQHSGIPAVPQSRIPALAKLYGGL